MKHNRINKLSWRLLTCFVIGIAFLGFADRSVDKYRTGWFWAALALVIAGEWTRIWAAGHLVKNKVLTFTGPYAYVKNPLYIGTFLLMVGFAIMARGDTDSVWWQAYMNWSLLGVGILVFILYYAPYKKKREGDRLRELFGDSWDHYDKNVPDYFPKFSRYERASTRPWSWAAACVNSEQWVLLGVIGGVAALYFNHFIFSFIESHFLKF